MREFPEVAYLGYQIDKVYKVLVAELPKRGYFLASSNYEKFEITVSKKKLFSKKSVISIQLCKSKTGSTRVEANSTQHRHDHNPSDEEIIIDEVLRIF